MRKIIQRALNRKQISQKYHTNVATFFKSEGPFNNYDHSLKIGQVADEAALTVTDKAALAALRRYEQDLLRLQHARETEKA